MDSKFSKRLEAILHVVLGGYLGEESREINLDKLFLAVMRDNEAYGSLIVNSLLMDWEIDRIMSRIENANSKSGAHPSCADPYELKEYVVSRLAVVYGDDIPEIINTGHLVFALVGDRRLSTCRIIERYSVTPLSVFLQLIMLPQQEEYMGNISMNS